jgi:hypothetical protein
MAERYKNQPKKIVGFQPTTDDAMFPMDEDLPPASASTVQTLSYRFLILEKDLHRK